MNKAVIYSRVSTEEQAKEDKFSLAVQKRVCREFAQKKKYEVVQIFEDAGKSATNTNRPALKNLMSFLEDNDIDFVLVQDTDRLARNTLDHLGIKAFFRKNNTQLISVSQQFIDDSAEGEMLDTVLASFNAFQSRISARKVKKGMEQRAISGWLPGLAPVGYKNIIAEDGKRIIGLDKEAAPLIKEAFELYIAGNCGAENINDLIYRKGLKSKRGGKLSLSKFYEMLENPFYYGEFQWAGKNYPGKHKPIIDKGTFELAQKVRAIRASRRSYERKHSFLLTGFVFCSCGRRLTAEIHEKEGHKTFSYYHCTRGRKCHDSRNVQITDLESQVEEYFKDVNFTNEFFDNLIKQLKFYYDNHEAENRRELRKLNSRKSEVSKKLSRIEGLLIDGDISKEVYKRNSSSLNKELEMLESEIYNLKQNNYLELREFEELIDFSRNIYDSYKNGNYAAKRNYLSFFWEKFIVEDKEIIEAVPTEPFRLIQEIQKPLTKGDNVNLTRVIKPGVWSG